ncbi:hypothetical protein ATO13_08486 [Stappia sp. 22II-S9-Z10]|nr:hypothetical protein ATO13_08486 [Stappia sp. 22II-S9-Z10]
MTLADYMAEARRAPFGYGPARMHCLRLITGAAAAQTGRDPAAPYAGRDVTEAAAAATLAAAGGIVRFAAGAFRTAGFARTREVREGDVALVRFAGEVIGAVRWRGAWWAKGAAGLARLADDQVRLVVAWAVVR